MSSYLRESLSEFWSGTISKVGTIFLVIVIALSFYTMATFPLDYGIRYWSNPKLWVDNPKAVGPQWINYFSNEKLLEHTVLYTNLPSRAYLSGGYYLKFYSLPFDLTINQFPTFINLKLENVIYHTSRPPAAKLFVTRPDNKTIELFTLTVEPPLPNESSPYVRYNIEPKRILLSGEQQIAFALSEYLLREYGISLTPSEVKDKGYEKIIFGEIEDNNFKPLNGKYIFETVLLARDGGDQIGKTSIVIGGQIYGVMGTDTLGRDLSQGLLFGFPVALLIGFTTSVITTLIGASLGIIGGYIGGRTDDVIQRASDIVNNLPQLPLLIFLAFIFGGKLWTIVLVLIAFGWPSLVIVVRSMILQIKSSSFIEAAISLGASKWRIMARHISPQVTPYILSQMIFYTPSAILAEAALSFLGLGDPSIPTWGQILEYGFRNGAVYLGYYWWILPPGLLIVFSAITFVLIALGLEPVVNPRLRRWK